MNGLDLLLNYSLFSECIHQRTLACLLKEIAVTRAFGIAGTPQSTSIEAYGRLFDISVTMEDGKEVHVEIKLDAVLGPDQLKRQREHIEKARHDMLYLLLGGSQFVTSGGDIVATWVGGYTQRVEAAGESGITLGPAVPTHSSVPRVLQLGEMITMLSDASPEITSVAVRELADAYRRCLEEIQNTFRSWKQVSVSQWTKAQRNGFYDYVRASLFPSASILNGYGQPVLVWGYRDLGVIRIAVDDFLEYGGVYLETKGNVVSIKLSVPESYDLNDSDEGEYPRGVRADFIRSLQNAARNAELQLEFTKPHVGADMTVAEFAGDYLTTKGSDTLDWNYASGMLRRLDSLVEDAVRLFRTHHETRAL